LQYVNDHFEQHQVAVAFEIGCCGFWAARHFLNYGWEVSVVHPADIKQSDKHRYQKTDTIDCRHICQQLQKQELKAIYIPPEAHEQLCSLLRQRNHITKMLRKEKSVIKASLLYAGITIPNQFDNPNWSHAFLDWLKNIDWSYATGQYSLHSKLRIFDVLHKEYLEVANQLRAWCRKHHHKDYYLLKSIPGIGGYLAAAVLAELGDLRRFDNERQLSNYIGLVPGIYQSDSTSKKMGLTPRCRSLLRSYIIEAAWTSLSRNPELQTYYRKHAGKDSKAIIVKVAHKLVRAMLSVIKNQKPYQINYTMPNKQQTNAA
ncbi:IS110 family transposase, partial [Ferruginibacter paludis]|uniref:IS110 family transposase n=1 Tax=Ferruginibacter paludis TaxID=1310417 RepID=UPI0025B38F76